ncbi:hypothetical protein [Streptosporangium amethystogenes]|uniref:hypothetical protein n=1 Tax=Streptosporangium amethystogenes TaxID=2002 RepID=UPI0012F73744|nr:hypothetical protein [Streptosporangium amethystogenes]
MDDERTTLVFGPSAAEILQADFPGWLIWRDFTQAGGHGDWCAQPMNAAGEEPPLRHAAPEGLRALLETSDDQ